MRNIHKYAMSRGETPKEFLDYCWKRVNHNQTCRDGTTLKDAAKVYANPFHQPEYVTTWFRTRELKLNGHSHAEMP